MCNWGKKTVVPLSVSRTKAIADECVSDYLLKLLEGARPATVPGRRPPREGRPRDRASRNEEQFAHPRPYPARHLSPHSPDSRPRGPPPFPQPVDRAAGGRDGVPYHLAPPSLGNPEVSHVQGRNRSHSDLAGPVRADEPPQPPGRLAWESAEHYGDPMMFKELENYLISSFKSCDCLNNSFSTVALPSRPQLPPNAEELPPPPPPSKKKGERSAAQAPIELDPKILLAGDLGENSSWWLDDSVQTSGGQQSRSNKSSSSPSRIVTTKSPRIDWDAVSKWYHAILTAGSSWEKQWMAMKPEVVSDPEQLARYEKWRSIDMASTDRMIREARLRLRRTLLKATESLLKRPRRPLKKPDDTRFLLILLENPMLHSSKFGVASSRRNERAPDSNYHSGIIKRILGLISKMPETCHNHFISWFSRFAVEQFGRTVELIGGFVTYRLMRQHGRKQHAGADGPTADEFLIPSFDSRSGNTAAEVYMAISGRQQQKSAEEKGDGPEVYGEDWQLRAAARVMALLFTANNANVSRRMDGYPSYEKMVNGDRTNNSDSNFNGHIVPIHTFYNSLLDYADLVTDFEMWESKSSKFTFCQYPFFLSIWAKIRIMEHDARRQMDRRAREAFFNSILNRKAISQFLVLRVRRDCLVEDSLRGVSEVIGAGQEEIKKGLRIAFVGEEGVDAGGLRKEWFLLLVREVFDPNHGM